MNENAASLRSQICPLLLMTGIFFLNFISRIILAPLMPTIEMDLGIGHAEAGSLFLLISLGYFTSLMGSGFFSSRFTHKKTIIFSSMFLGIALLAVSFSNTLWEIRIGCIIVGLAAGLYLPSGISALTSLVRSEDWGKAIAIHELAPNLSFLAAPLISEALSGMVLPGENILGTAWICISICWPDIRPPRKRRGFPRRASQPI